MTPSRPRRLHLSAHQWTLLLTAGLGAAIACLRPPGPGAETASTEAVQTEQSASGEVTAFLDSTWGDSSGSDGAGGVKMSVSEQKKLPLLTSDFDKTKRGDAVTKENPGWQLFFGPGDRSLAFDWLWVTNDSDKFYSKTWGGGGVAFNGSWGAIDATAAKYLVLWVKATKPGVDIAVNLHSASKAKSKEDTGQIKLSEFVPGGSLDEHWRRVVIPLSAFPEVNDVDLKGLQQLIFNLQGGFPENQKTTILVDNVFLTNIDMVTPVTNLGYLVRDDGVQLEWSKDTAEKLSGFTITANGKEVLKAPASARSALVPRSALGTGKAKLAVATVGANEASEPISIDVDPKPAASVEAKVTLGAPTHDISPHIYGVNGGSYESLKGIGATGRRWGGNRSTKYNWKGDVDSAGVDWFYLNDEGKAEGTPEEQKGYYKYIKDTLAAGAEVNFCLPVTDWVAKPKPGGPRYCSYPLSVYPKQQKNDGQGCGNGLTPEGKLIWDNDPNLSMIKNTPELQREFVQTVVKNFGTAAKGGVEFYSMDNEPGLWKNTHRDTVPRGLSAEDLKNRNLTYAKLVKSVDPSAKVIGFGAWGVLELAGSNDDYAPGGADGYKLDRKQTEEERYRERKKHGGDSQLVYLLKQFKQAEAQAGKRLIDVIDVHWYQELYAKDSKGQQHRTLNDLAYDPKFTPVQFEALREWWDPTFKTDALITSWTFDANADYLWTPYHPVIPTLKQLVETYYPGTKLAINEYDNGSPEHYHGALLRAASLGIFMQQDLYMAQNWHQTDSKEFTWWAQKMYGNYDGQGSKILGKFVPTTSDQKDLMSYAAVDGARQMVVLINKNPSKRITTSVGPLKGQARTYTLAETLGFRLLEGNAEIAGGQTQVTVPPFAAVLVVAQ